LPSAKAKPNPTHQSTLQQNPKKNTIPPNIQKNIKVIRHDGYASRQEPEVHSNHPKYLNQTENSLNKINPSDQ